MNTHALGATRARWAAFGAAIAVSIGGGGIAITQAAISSGDRGVYTPIAPCRVFDTRSGPDNVGTRSSAIGAGETVVEQITGANGNCTTPIPADATGVAMNVTAVGGSAASYLTIWPSDLAARPLASSLNWVPGSPPTPNKVDSKLSATGQISLYNNVGSVDILADIVGYYSDHNHDDRYYPRAETYNKTETYNTTEVYNKTEADSQFQTQAAAAASPSSHLVAGGYVFANGLLLPTESFGNVQTVNTGVGSYQITLPGYDPGCVFSVPAPFLTATISNDTGFVSASGGTGTDCFTGDVHVFVNTASSTGVPADRDFTFALYVDG